MHIRSACMMDKDEIYKLVCDAFDAPLDKEAFESILWENINNAFAYYIVAVEHENIIGFASLSIEKALHTLGTFAKIQEFSIMQCADKKLAANALMEALMQKASQLNCLFLEIRVKKPDIIEDLESLQMEYALTQHLYHIPL